MNRTLEVTETLRIPAGEIVATATTSGGPGGQNVNRVRTRVTVAFDVAGSPSLDEAQRARILERLGGRIDRGGRLRVRSQKHRTQGQNRRAAEERLADLLRDALREMPARRATRKPRAGDERRLEEKRRRARVKAYRRNPSGE